MKRATREWLRAEAEGYGDTHMNDAPRDALDSDARQRAEIRRLRAALVKIHAVTKPVPLAQLPRDTAPLVWEVEAIVRAALRPAKATR